MTLKSLIQFSILILIIIIIGGVYYKYFNTNEKIVEEVNLIEKNSQKQLEELEKKILDLELKNEELNSKINKETENLNSKLTEVIPSAEIKPKIITKNKLKVIEENKNNEKKNDVSKPKIKNLVKDAEYISIDQKGNKFYLLANSGKSNINNTDILDLINVRGKIMSDKRDTIYIVSDYAQYNSINSNSKFYDNVIINYQNKEIICENFDINMDTNKAIAYNNVVVTDPKSIMKAGIVEFDLKTKNININPENSTNEIEVVTN